jgi:hypothetical protein
MLNSGFARPTGCAGNRSMRRARSGTRQRGR